MNSNNSTATGLISFLTVEQIATLLAVSNDTVARKFEKLDGTIDLGTPETLHKRRKRILRIPHST